MLGIKNISHILYQFGLGKKTGIELPSERSGVVPSPQWKLKYYGSSWYKGDTIITGIGQGFMLATPLQMAKATLILANKGHDKPLTLIKHNAVKNQRAQATIKLKNPSFWYLIDEALVGVINSSKPWGTGYAFGRHPPYSVAAKTGTAQVFSIKNRHNEHKVKQEDLPKKLRDNALFIAYSPTDHPKIVVAVVLEHTKTSIAARITRQIIDYYYQHTPSP